MSNLWLYFFQKHRFWQIDNRNKNFDIGKFAICDQIEKRLLIYMLLNNKIDYKIVMKMISE